MSARKRTSRTKGTSQETPANKGAARHRPSRGSPQDTPDPRRSRPRGAPKPRHPRLRLLKRRRGVMVWLVDGSYIRKNIDEEFSNFGHHGTFPEIPKDEIWIDEESDPDEHEFFLAHAALERRLMLAGKDQDTARRLANTAERKLRIAAGDVRKVTAGRDLPQPNRVHTRLVKKLNNGVAVWLVDGRLVRSAFDIEFTEGGHEHVYEFVPHDEVWIDDDVHEDELGYVIFHELHERALMEKGMTYDDAHRESSKREGYLRKHPAELHQALADEGWE